jgi:arylsulfatase A-like enzyme
MNSQWFQILASQVGRTGSVLRCRGSIVEDRDGPPYLYSVLAWVTVLLLLTYPRVSASQPNIIIFLADDLGYADVGFNGCEDIPTPHIDSIAAKGVKFTDGYANHPVCSPSRAGLLSGRYQHSFGFENNSGPEEYSAPNFGIPRDVPILAERLKDVGYKTAWVGKWHVGFNEGLRPHERGFDYTYGFHAGARTFYPNGPHQNHQMFRNGEPFDGETEYLTDAFAREAIAFIDQSGPTDSPFFLFFSFNAVHLPLEATKQYERRFPDIKDKNRKTYAGMLAALDDAIGGVMGKVRQLQQEEDTLVFFYSDNGGPTPQTTSRNDPLRGYKGQMFEGGIRVPFAIQWPERIPAGETYEHPIMGFDVTATALAAAGITLSADDTLDGKDLLPYLEGSVEGVPHSQLFWRAGNQHAARVGNWKLVKPRGQSEMLFDLSQDIGETKDLSKSHPEKLKEVRGIYNAWSSQMEEPRWIRQDRRNAEKGGKLKTASMNSNGSSLNSKQRIERLFRNDKNGDGRLTRREYQGPYFDTLDWNGNGIITRREAEAAIRQATSSSPPESAKPSAFILIGNGGKKPA